MAFNSEQISKLTRASNDFTYFVNNILSESVKTFIPGEYVDQSARYLSQNKRTIKVSARHHFKSFSLYAYIMWKILFEGAHQSLEIHYFSFNKSMAGYHVKKLKETIEANPFFDDLTDLKKNAETIGAYTWDGKKEISITPHGMIQFKRGIHGDLIFVDDPLQDPDSDLNPTVIYKINEIFSSNILDMPNKPNGELHVVGCLDPDTDIPVKNKGLIPLKKVEKGDYIYGTDQNLNIKPKKVESLVDNGVQKVYRLKTESNKEIDATGNHPFLTRKGWVELNDLKEGDYIAVPRKIPEGNKERNESEMQLLGYLIGDGSFCKKDCCFFSSDIKKINKVKKLCDDIGIDYKLYSKNSKNREDEFKSENEEYKLWLKGKIWDYRKKYNLEDCIAKEKQIPFNIFESSEKDLKNILVGLIDSDGHISDKRKRIGYSSTSEKLIKQVDYILRILGIPGRIRKREGRGVTGKTTIYEWTSSSYINLNSLLSDLKKRGMVKNYNFNPSKDKGYGHNIPLNEEEYTEIKKHIHIENKVVSEGSLIRKGLDKKFSSLLDNDVVWLKVKDITYLEEKPTLNLTVEGGNFIANNIITHNTPQTKQDFFFQDNITNSFRVWIAPAIQEDEETGVKKALWPEWMSLEDLEAKRDERTERIFQKEYMCQPVQSTKSFFKENDLREQAVNKNLVDLDPHKNHPELKRVKIVAGFDIGKKKDPSHLGVFKLEGNVLKMIHSRFMDGWPYSKKGEFRETRPSQIEYLRMAINNFHIDELRYDNTRSEFEIFDDQGILPRQMIPMKLTTKTRHPIATNFDKIVERGQLEIFDNQKLITQITSVNNALQAPRNKDGHGDAFWSIGLGVLGAVNELGLEEIESTPGIERVETTTGGSSLFGSGTSVPKGW